MTVKTPAPPPLPDELERLLHRLRLPYVRRAAPDVIATATSQRWEPAEVLRVLLAEEAAGRDRATIRTRRRASGLPAGKTLDAWEPDRSVIPSATQQALRTLEWIDRHEVLCVSDEREESAHPWLKASLGFLIGAGIWVTTWVLPATFMVAMAWGCETHARQLGRRALLFYDGDADSAQAAIAAAKQREDRGHGKREILRATLLVLSIAIPIGFVAYADHVRQSTGINWVGALGALAPVSLVIAASVLANRR